MAFVMQFSFAQERTITGNVTSVSDGLPLPGVNVIVKGTTRGVQTDFDGNYSIRASATETLVFSFVSMKNAERLVGSNNTINVAMEDDIAALDEVVVTGYATTTKTKSSIASVTISAETIENRPNASFVQTLSGQVPGLNITTASGQPGGNSTVNLRGITSINGNTEPLFIIDGAPVDEDNFRSLNPQDIASISVLKDAGATAIYGNRGANGVVVIKTRTGSYNQGLKINYNGSVAFSSLQDNDYNLLNSQQQLTLEREYGNGRGASGNNGGPLTDAQIGQAETFDWADFFFREALTKNHNVSLTSGGENSSQFTSFGFSDIQGVLQQSTLKRFNIRSNVTGKTTDDKLNYGTNLTINYSNSDEPNSIGSGAINRNYILGAYQSVPYITPDDYTDGAALLSPLSFANTPLFLLDRLRTYQRNEEEVKIVGSLNAGYKLTDNFTANVVLSADYQSEFLTRSEGPASFNALLFGGAQNPTSGFQDQQTTRVFTYNQVTSLNYHGETGKHTVDAGVYTEYFKAHLKTFGFRNRGLDPKTFSPGDGSGFIGTSLDPNTGAILFLDTPNANINTAGLFSYFGTVDYDYDARYGFTGTVRRDASSRFAQSNKWATFWSVAGRWNISNEAFMEDSVFDVLKLRASYGKAGNDRITGTLFGALDITENFFNTGQGYANLVSIFPGAIGNTTLRWETVTQTNIGLDFELFNRRLRGSFDVYDKETTDLFQSRPVSAINGQTNLSANIGSLSNRGADVQLDFDIVRATSDDDLNLTLSFVGNYNKTELLELPSDDGEIIGIGREGGKLFEYFTIRYAGVNPANGELLFLDANGNITENPNADTDRVWLDQNIFPDFNGSFGLNADYKGFFLTTQFNYTIGVDRFDNDLASFQNPDNIGQFRHSVDILRAWQQPGDVTDIPALRATNRNAVGSTRYLRNADYLRLRFASVGYNMPTKYLDNTGFSSMRFFLNGENLLTFTEWRGFDAEALSNTSRLYPTPRTFSVGLELGF